MKTTKTRTTKTFEPRIETIEEILTIKGIETKVTYRGIEQKDLTKIINNPSEEITKVIKDELNRILNNYHISNLRGVKSHLLNIILKYMDIVYVFGKNGELQAFQLDIYSDSKFKEYDSLIKEHIDTTYSREAGEVNFSFTKKKDITNIDFFDINYKEKKKAEKEAKIKAEKETQLIIDKKREEAQRKFNKELSSRKVETIKFTKKDNIEDFKNLIRENQVKRIFIVKAQEFNLDKDIKVKYKLINKNNSYWLYSDIKSMFCFPDDSEYAQTIVLHIKRDFDFNFEDRFKEHIVATYNVDNI